LRRGLTNLTNRAPTTTKRKSKNAVGISAGGNRILEVQRMTDPLSKLPLFATDREIAVAVVGKERA
jgi:hypothetical protein